jgi:enoyl-[acyl-carrier protein] reductase I
VEKLRQSGATILTYNTNALDAESRRAVLDGLTAAMGGGKLKAMVHAVARGNLKLLAPYKERERSPAETETEKAAQTLFRYPEGNREFFLSSEDFRLTIEAMATSLWDWAQDILQRNLWAADSRIIGLTSEGAHKAWPYYAAVSVAKSALEALCRSMALELGPHGIRTNIIQSGVADTLSLQMIPGSEAMKSVAAAKNPLGRMTRPEDVAGVIYLLCRDEAAWINGSIIRVDGGEAIS